MLEFLSKKYLKQFGAVIAVHLVTVGYGVTVGWTAPIIPLLRSEDTPLPAGPITVEQASWIGSSLCIGGMTGTVLFALIHTYFGKKIGLLLLAVPHLILWSLIWAGDNVYYIYVARVLSGVTGGGLLTIVPLFVADIADRKIRGALGSLTILHINFGVLASYTAGTYLPYYRIPPIMLVLPVAYLALVSFLPETPYCLLRKGRVDQAEKSLMFYRNVTDDSDGAGAGTTGATRKTLAFQYEFDALKAFVLAERTRQGITLADFQTPTAIRGLFVGVFVMALNQFSGILAILTYAGTILQQSGTTFDNRYALILLALINICGNLTSFAIIDKAGRKFFLLISTVGVGIFLTMLGLHSYYYDPDADSGQYSWVPVFSLAGVIYSAALGITNVPFFVLPEILPPKLRSIGSTIAVVLLCFFAFFVMKAYPLLLEAIGIHGTLWISSVVCAVGVVIIVFLVPETKGKNLVVEEQQQESEANKTRTNAF
ncbi:facilitated trehalose transporter Tret1-like isoform X2 [Culex pipiens pallens]|uniref:facilitated trehalose transporter Tret1-like isoform X2 n=1 Tax=Culex pipiens pallens TaxID=42434 RepID=UPI0019541CFC|nr:facilitated trehalose transporter Tret1-like isoform X2 [Culex pipiens pallens]